MVYHEPSGAVGIMDMNVQYARRLLFEGACDSQAPPNATKQHYR
jgi:hypothetical protein